MLKFSLGLFPNYRNDLYLWLELEPPWLTIFYVLIVRNQWKRKWLYFAMGVLVVAQNVFRTDEFLPQIYWTRTIRWAVLCSVHFWSGLEQFQDKNWEANRCKTYLIGPSIYLINCLAKLNTQNINQILYTFNICRSWLRKIISLHAVVNCKKLRCDHFTLLWSQRSTWTWHTRHCLVLLFGNFIFPSISSYVQVKFCFWAIHTIKTHQSSW